MKACGSGDLAHQICIPNKDQCPINEIVMLKNNQPLEEGQEGIILAGGV